MYKRQTSATEAAAEESTEAGGTVESKGTIKVAASATPVSYTHLDMAGRDSGGEGQNPKYVALLAGFAMLYMQQSNRDSKIKLVLLDEAFSKMDQERSAVCLKYRCV